MTPGTPRKHFSMIREFHLADWFTLANAVCGVSRLARQDVTAASLSEGTGKVKCFEGTPIPTSVLLVLLLAFAARSGAVGKDLWFGVVQLGGFDLHPLVLVFALSGSLMVSRIRIPKP